ncbi:MAG: radical SAM family RiPP maturation amino acid epimerase, partial [Rhodospirillaceae bacterium]|nr:radical SAM family RiPP maturation amino acid epimerase [Rhodospirillaceae bacterium]
MAATQETTTLPGQGAQAFFASMFASRTDAELESIASTKRFFERYIGDVRFREALQAGESPQALCDARGLAVDAERLKPIWQNDLWQTIKDEGRQEEWSEAFLWARWVGQLLEHRDMLKEHAGHTDEGRFSAWRRRQMNRTDSELGPRNRSITHPIVAYELTKGCTVGCWFCGIAAEEYQGAFPYTPDNAALWQGVLEVMHARFGEASQTGFCYWATDPMDSPDYDRFITDHWNIVGWLPQTTTAAPLKDEALTRRVMALFDQALCVINRFSVISLRQLDTIHAAFTPRELLAVELVMQNKGALTHKAVAGRVRSRREQLQELGREASDGSQLDTGTIACVSGFLINMVERKVQLVSPCAASGRWPLGYRIYDQGRFETPEDFADQIERMIDAHMPEGLQGEAVIRIRDDLQIGNVEDGALHLGNDFVKHTVSGFPFIERLVNLIGKDGATVRHVMERMSGEGEDVFAISAMIQELYDS